MISSGGLDFERDQRDTRKDDSFFVSVGKAYLCDLRSSAYRKGKRESPTFSWSGGRTPISQGKDKKVHQVPLLRRKEIEESFKVVQGAMSFTTVIRRARGWRRDDGQISYFGNRGRGNESYFRRDLSRHEAGKEPGREKEGCHRHDLEGTLRCPPWGSGRRKGGTWSRLSCRKKGKKKEKKERATFLGE